MSFLYSGTNPIQTGVAPGTIDPLRVAVIRGVVITRDSQPLPGVAVSVVGRPEFGSTYSRLDGAYDLAVNGGQRLTLSFARAGHLPAQRPIEPVTQAYAQLEDVALVPNDTVVTVVDFSEPVEVVNYPHWHADFLGKPWSKFHLPLVEPIVGLWAILREKFDPCN